jgi:YVTN family beta-propeller protein
MMSFRSSTLLKIRTRVISGFLRLFILSLSIAAFGFTSLHAQVVSYVTNVNFPPSVFVIDTANPDQGVVSTIPVGFFPSSVLFSSDGTRAYISNPGSGTVSVIDTASNTVVASIRLPTGPEFFQAITPDGKHLYETDGCCRVLVVDTATNTMSSTIFVGNGPGPIAVTPDGLHVYVVNQADRTVSVIDTSSNTVVGGPIPVTSQSSFAGGLVFTPDGGHAYVGGSGITVINTSNNSTTTIPLPPTVSATSLAITPDGGKVLFTTHSFTTGVPSSLGVIRTADNTVQTAFSFPAQANLGFGNQVAITPDGGFAWVSDNAENLIWIFSTTTMSVVDQVPVSHPFAIAIADVSPRPIAVAGPNQTVRLGQTVHLDGSGSFAPNTAPANLTYAWSFVSQPAGSAAVLNDANTATPSFIADVPGDFVVQLIVTDPATLLSSKPSRLTVSSLWSPPTADPGPAQSAVVGEVVQLNGGGSTDPNGLPLTGYFWSFVAQPDGSAAVITPQGNGLASFIPDLAGTYIVGLTVSDAFGSSPQATVAISVITRDDFAQKRIHDAINYIAAMPCSHFDACGHRNALSNYLQQAISDIQSGNISQATGKLNDAIIRTDGFPLHSTLDGDGPGMDWIMDANDQAFVFPALTDAINALTQSPI